MGEYFVNKVETIRNGITSNQFQAMRTYRKLILRVENDFVMKRKSVEDVYKIIMRHKTSNAKGMTR